MRKSVLDVAVVVVDDDDEEEDDEEVEAVEEDEKEEDTRGVAIVRCWPSEDEECRCRL